LVNLNNKNDLNFYVSINKNDLKFKVKNNGRKQKCGYLIGTDGEGDNVLMC